MFRLLVAGGRDYYAYRFIEQTLTDWFVNEWSEEHDTWEETDAGITVVHGDAGGVDRIAAMWATYNNFVVEPHPADWTKYGKSGGNVRNAQMIESGIDYAILFPGGRGTANMKFQLMRAKIDYREYGTLDDDDEVVYTK
jgi:hypothetical protein